MYIYPRRNKRRLPVFIGLFAFACTAVFILGFLLVQEPGQLLATLRLEANASTPTATQDATAGQTSDSTATTTNTPRPRGTNTPKPTKTLPPSPTLEPTNTPINVLEHFILGRPVPPNASSIIPQWTYLYGDTQHGNLGVHHGEEFVNPVGTPVLAAADGVIVVAGDDSQPHCGADGTRPCGDTLNFYGNLVVVKLDQGFAGQDVYTLCGHMNSVGVKVGQHVSAGDQVGTVGSTGIALGPHCHFEVRLGVDDYGHTRNPILWMTPLAGRGALAGLVQDRNGNRLRSVNVFLYQDDATQEYLQDTETYGRDSQLPVNQDDWLHENWAMGDLPAGKYVVRVPIGGLDYIKHVQIQPGKLTFVVIGGE